MKTPTDLFCRLSGWRRTKRSRRPRLSIWYRSAVLNALRDKFTLRRALPPSTGKTITWFRYGRLDETSGRREDNVNGNGFAVNS